jgi:hypothetical protein
MLYKNIYYKKIYILYKNIYYIKIHNILKYTQIYLINILSLYRNLRPCHVYKIDLKVSRKTL